MYSSTELHTHPPIQQMSSKPEKFGNPIPFTEPYWYQGYHSPYYHDGHKALRAKVRKFVEEEIKPNIDRWIENGEPYPKELHERAYQVCFMSCSSLFQSDFMCSLALVVCCGRKNTVARVRTISTRFTKL